MYISWMIENAMVRHLEDSVVSRRLIAVGRINTFWLLYFSL